MNVFSFHSVEIDRSALRAFVQMGRWPDEVSGKPSGTRLLSIELSIVDESTPIYASELAMSFDWTETIDDAEYLAIDGVLAEKPIQPNVHCIFDYITKTWVDPRTLIQWQDAQWELIKVARTNYTNAVLPTPYGVFDCDPVSRNSITDAVLMLQTLAGMGQTPTIDFTLADNTVVVMSLESMVTVGLLVGQPLFAGGALA